MPLPSVSSPFDNLVAQVKQDLNHAVRLCEDIPEQRKLGRSHPELDRLKQSLRGGPGFIQGEYETVDRIAGADTDGADDFARADFTGYVRQVEEIVAQLEGIAYPPSRHHQHGWHTYYLLPFLSPYYHRRVEEHPHFHDMRLKWENVRDGIPQTFAEMRKRLLQKEKDRKKREAEEQELKDDKQKLQDKLDIIQKENNKKLEDEGKHQEEQREKHEDLEEKRDKEVEKLVKHRLGEDPIQRLDDLAGVIQHIHKAVTPRSSGYWPGGGYSSVPGYYPPDPSTSRVQPIRITNFNSNHDEEVDIEEFEDDQFNFDVGNAQMSPFLPRGRSLPPRRSRKALPHPAGHGNVFPGHGNGKTGWVKIVGGKPVDFFPGRKPPTW